jgi:hypothetical protein
VSQHFIVGQIVDRDYFEIGFVFNNVVENLSANATESIDGNLHSAIKF